MSIQPFNSDGGFSTTGNVNAHDATFTGNINGAGNYDIDGNATIGGNLFVSGNINFTGNVTQISGNSGVFYGNASTGVGALYAGKTGYTPLPSTIVQITGDENAYIQTNLQNTNHGTTASMELAITADDGTDTTNYIDIGIASSTWDGTQDNSLGTAVAQRDGYLYVQGGSTGGNLILGTTTAGYEVKFNAGGPNSGNTIARISNLGIISSGIVSATGNISGNYILGNIAFATGGGSSSYGDSNVATLLASFGSNTISSTGNVTTTANISGNYILGNIAFATGSSSYGDSNVATLLASFGSNAISTTGNVNTGNIITTGTATVTGNVTTTGYFISGNQATGGFKLGNVNSRIAVGGGNSYMTFGQNPAIYPDTSASAFAGVLIGGNGYLLAPNGSRTLTLQGTGNVDVTGSLNLPNGGHVVTTGNVSAGNITSSASITRSGNYPQPAWTTSGIGLKMPTAVYTDTTSSGTVANSYIHAMAAPTVAASSATTYTNYATLFVAQPTPSTNTTVTNNYAIMASGNVSVSGNVTSGGNVSVSGNITVSGANAISIPNLPGFRVYGNGVTNVSTTTNTTGVLNGNNWAVDYNQGSYLNLTTGTFTAPVAGLYQVNLVARVSNNTAATAQAIVIKNRASTNLPQVMWESAANPTINHFGVSTVSKLAVGDTLNLVITVGNLTFDQNDNWSVAFLG